MSYKVSVQQMFTVIAITIMLILLVCSHHEDGHFQPKSTVYSLFLLSTEEEIKNYETFYFLEIRSRSRRI